MLELGLRDLEKRLLAGLAGELRELRAAARELRDLDLGAEEDRSCLVEDSRFFYLLTRSVGWSELVSDTVRRHLPGGAWPIAGRLSSWWLRRIDLPGSRWVGSERIAYRRRPQVPAPADQIFRGMEAIDLSLSRAVDLGGLQVGIVSPSRSRQEAVKKPLRQASLASSRDLMGPVTIPSFP
jgi:hypothetical protein